MLFLCQMADSSTPEAFITVNSIAYKHKSAHQLVFRRLEMNWSGLKDRNGVRIRLYQGDPKENGSKLVKSIDPKGFPDNFTVTNIQLPYLDSEEMG